MGGIDHDRELNILRMDDSLQSFASLFSDIATPRDSHGFSIQPRRHLTHRWGRGEGAQGLPPDDLPVECFKLSAIRGGFPPIRPGWVNRYFMSSALRFLLGVCSAAIAAHGSEDTFTGCTGFDA